MSIWRNGAAVADAPLLDRVLEVRGLCTSQDKEDFLSPDFCKHLHSPFVFKQMKRAVDRVRQAVFAKEKICVFGDYDVDGVTATALVYRLLSFLNSGELLPLLPHRVNDGYGITVDAVQKAAEFGATLIITVDNGITGHDAVKLAATKGIDVVITDHHQPSAGIPDAYAVINPWVEGEEYPFVHLSGVGVAYKLAAALLSAFPELPGREAFMKWSLDLVALGTVADVMELRGENRVFVYYGLQVIAQSRLPGLRALLVSAQVEQHDSEMIGYRLGPRINAAGRLDSAEKAFQLLTTDHATEAETLAKELEKLNRQRQSMVRSALQDAVAQAESQIANGECIVLVKSEKWHPGIIGLIAGRLADRFALPAVAMTCAMDDSCYVASCRSIKQFDASAAISHFDQYFTKSGGHAQAGGFTLPVENLAVFEEGFFSYAKQALDGVVAEDEYQIDSEVTVQELTLDNCYALQRLQPFGEGNPEPLLLLRDIRLIECRKVGSDGGHLRIGTRSSSGVVYGIGFGMGHYADNLDTGGAVDILFHLRVNRYKGSESPQYNIIDIRSSSN